MKRLSKKQMWIFALGQLGWSMLGGIINAWLVTFYLPTKTDIADNGATQFIVPGLIIGGFLTVLGLITALSRVFDAVTDPLIASMSDRSKNKRGRRIPFMQWGLFHLLSSQFYYSVPQLMKSLVGTLPGFPSSLSYSTHS